MDEAREFVKQHRGWVRGGPPARIHDDWQAEVEEFGPLGFGGLDPPGSESVLDAAFESERNIPVKFRDW
jgi:hypothetical protein